MGNSSDALHGVLAALADRSRRAILDRLREAPGLTLGRLCAALAPGPGRCAVMKHLSVLERVGLVRSWRVGRERRLFVRAAPLAVLDRWVARHLAARPAKPARPATSERGRWLRRDGAGRTVDADGAPVRDPETLRRIAALAIPPAWKDVRISPSARARVQATGRDARGRKQAIYHPSARAARDEARFERTVAFARALPRLRARVRRDLAREGLPREKVLGAVVRLLETTALRVGNEHYARTNRTFGLTTLLDRHARPAGPALELSFRGKHGKMQRALVTDRRVAAIVRTCRDLPGEPLFQYVDGDGATRTIDSAAVNAYVRETAGAGFGAKDFRTWAATSIAARGLVEAGAAGSPAQAERNVRRAVERAARHLGNTPEVCRASYVHPGVIEAYVEGRLERAIEKPARRIPGLEPAEAGLVAVLSRR